MSRVLSSYVGLKKKRIGIVDFWEEKILVNILGFYLGFLKVIFWL